MYYPDVQILLVFAYFSMMFRPFMGWESWGGWRLESEVWPAEEPSSSPATHRVGENSLETEK